VDAAGKGTVVMKGRVSGDLFDQTRAMKDRVGGDLFDQARSSHTRLSNDEDSLGSSWVTAQHGV
jgi:hypothetical protein